MHPASKQPRTWVIVFGLALAVRAGYCAWVNTGPYPFQNRYREYIISGRGILEHKMLLSPLSLSAGRVEPSALMPPLYSVWVAGVYAAVGVESRASVYVLQLANALASALGCAFAFRIADSIAGRKAAWIASLIVTFNPALVGFTDYVWDTSFFTLGVALSVWFALRLRHGEYRSVKMAGFGIWLGFVALLNPALTLAYPLLVLFAIRVDHPFWSRRITKGIFVSVLGWILAVFPWTVRNHVQLGTVSYVRSGLWLEIWHGIAPEADKAGASVFQAQFPLNNPEEAKRAAELGEQEYIRQRGVFARKAIAENPLRFVKLVFMRTADFWLGSGMTHAGPHGRFWPATRTRQLVMLVFALESLLIMLGFFNGAWRLSETRWLFGIVAVFSIVYCITQVQVRFRVPIEPLVAILVGMAVARNLPGGPSKTP